MMINLILAVCTISSMVSFYLAWKARREYEAALANILADEQRFYEKVQQDFRDLRNDQLRKDQLKHLERRVQ